MFDPDRPITREELSVMLNNVLMYENNAEAAIFTDVTPAQNPWSYDSIQALCAGGVMSGYQDGTFIRAAP